MKKKVQVILLEDISPLGSAGDVVSVAEGYARNFLFSQGKAALATDQVIASIKAKEEKRKETTDKQLTDLQTRAQALDGTELTITAKAKEGEAEGLYGSITAAQIAKQLNGEASLDLKAKDVVLDKPLTTLGNYDITIKLSTDVETTIRVVVVPEKNSTHADQQEET